MANLEALKDRLNTVQPTDYQLVFLTTRRGGVLEGQRVELADDLAKEILEQLVKNTRQYVEDAVELREYDPTASLKDSMEHIPLKELENAQVLGPIESRAVKVSKDVFRRLKAYTLAVGTDENRLMFVVKQPPAKLLKSDVLTMCFFSDGGLTRSTEDAVIIETDPDCVVFGGDVYILSKYSFESIFGYLEQIKRLASAQMDALLSNPLFSVSDRVVEGVKKDGRRARRLSKLTIDHLDILTVDICERLREEYHLRFEVRDGKVVADNEEAVLDILKVVNDNLLQSSFTEARYEVLVKDPISIPE